LQKRRPNPWKYLSPVAFTCLDAGLTLFGQPTAYWLDYSNAMEMAPQFSFLLQIHPLVFVAGIGAWILAYTLLIRFTPTWPSLVVSLTFTLGHAFGAATWLLYFYRLNYFFLFLFFPLLAAIVILVVKKEEWPKEELKAADESAPSTSVVRPRTKKEKIWCAIAGVSAVCIIADYWWAQEKAFFMLYEPHIDPSITYVGTRFEAIIWAPLFMILSLWWLTVPLVGMLVFSLRRLGDLKKTMKASAALLVLLALAARTPGQTKRVSWEEGQKRFGSIILATGWSTVSGILAGHRVQSRFS